MPLNNRILVSGSNYGTYTGTGADHRAILHNLGRIPSCVIIIDSSTVSKPLGTQIRGFAATRFHYTGTSGSQAETAADVYNFYVSDADILGMNKLNMVYYWVVF